LTKFPSARDLVLQTRSIVQSVRATGGVYKGQGRIPGGMVNRDPYEAFLVVASRIVAIDDPHEELTSCIRHGGNSRK